MKNANVGFTLIELLIVIAIVGLISVLAIQKLSGLKTDTQAKVNVANMKRIDNAIETYFAGNANKGVNRLDNLVKYNEPNAAEGSTDALNSPLELVDPSLAGYVYEANRGLYTNLVTVASGWGMTFPPILGKYYLREAEAAALLDFGLKYLMRGTDGSRRLEGDDKAWAKGSINDPDACSCVATSVMTGMCVAVVNPGAVSGSLSNPTPVGANIYKCCGTDIYYTSTGRFVIDGVEYADNQAAFEALRDSEKGGVIVACGLGEFASIVGDEMGGLDTAPFCPDIQQGWYRRYIVLLRVRRLAAASSGYEVVYAGLMDPRGRTLRELLATL